MHRMALRARRMTWVSIAATAFAVHAPAAVSVPDGFVVDIVANGLAKPTGVAVAPDGTVFIAEQRGLVRVVRGGAMQVGPFLDLQDEVGFAWDRGLLSIELDPAFDQNGFVYLFLVVDPIPGRPEEPPQTPTFGRIVRYRAIESGDSLVADRASRHVVLGMDAADGVPCCYRSHSVGDLVFGLDGSLFALTGDGANFNIVDGGGDPACEALFGEELDIGAFRAQSLDSLAGKVLRIDPESGLGLPDNPFFDGDPSSARSRIWASGLRNPFRAAVDPRSAGPGTLYVADVGWNLREEVSAVAGGENLGWPCYEGLEPPPGYQDIDLEAWDCGTIETAGNPGPLAAPVLQWHHSDPTQSVPAGLFGRCAVAGVWVEGPLVAPSLAGSLLVADHIDHWIRAVRFDDHGAVASVSVFATAAQRPTDFAMDPTTGDIVYVAFVSNTVYRIRALGPDLDGSGAVDGADLAAMLAAWGSSGPADLDGSGAVDGADLGRLLGAWTR
jgi:glucose/arabinose dehydrogenase